MRRDRAAAVVLDRPPMAVRRCGGCDFSTSWALDLHEHLVDTKHPEGPRCPR